MKRKLITFGMLGVAVLPAIAVVSCGNNDVAGDGIYPLAGEKTRGISLEVRGGHLVKIHVDTDQISTPEKLESAFYYLETAQDPRVVFGVTAPENADYILKLFRDEHSPELLIELTHENEAIQQYIDEATMVDHSTETTDNYNPIQDPNVLGQTNPTQVNTHDRETETEVEPNFLHNEVTLNKARNVQEVSQVLSVYERTDWSTFNLKNKFAGQDITATVYHTRFMDFAFDKNTHITDEEARYFINRFYETTTFGYGLLQADTMLFVACPLDVLGVRSGKDTLNWMPDLTMPTETNPEVKERKKQEKLQEVFDTARHEYGHHETLTPVGDRGPEVNIANALIAGGYPVAEGLRARINGDQAYFDAAAASIKAQGINPDGSRLAVAYQGQTVTNEPLYSAPYWANNKQKAYTITKDGFDLRNYLLDGAETYNRAINVLEYVPYNGITHPEYMLSSIIGWVDVWMYYTIKADHSAKLLDPKTGLYDQANTRKIIELWNQYVYRNTTDMIYLSPWEIRGYSSKDFDFVTVPYGANDLQTYTMKSVQSHFITGRTRVEDAPSWGGQIAYYKKHNKGVAVNKTRAVNHEIPTNVNPVTGSPIGTDTTQVPGELNFYQDTNHSGVFDAGDLKVEDVNYTIVRDGSSTPA